MCFAVIRFIQLVSHVRSDCFGIDVCLAPDGGAAGVGAWLAAVVVVAAAGEQAMAASAAAPAASSPMN